MAMKNKNFMKCIVLVVTVTCMLQPAEMQCGWFAEMFPGVTVLFSRFNDTFQKNKTVACIVGSLVALSVLAVAFRHFHQSQINSTATSKELSKKEGEVKDEQKDEQKKRIAETRSHEENKKPEKKKKTFEELLQAFKENYSKDAPYDGLRYLGKAGKVANILSHDLELLSKKKKKEVAGEIDLYGKKEFNNRNDYLYILPDQVSDDRLHVDRKLKDILLAQEGLEQFIEDEQDKLQYHYKIHLMPPSKKKKEGDPESLYITDPGAATEIVAKVMQLCVYNNEFRAAVDTIKVIRKFDIIPDLSGNMFPFMVIYPQMVKGAALTVARILDKELSFNPTDKAYAEYPVPRFNLKFNPNKPQSGIFYAMGNADQKGDEEFNKKVFKPGKNNAIFNDEIAKLVKLESFELKPE